MKTEGRLTEFELNTVLPTVKNALLKRHDAGYRAAYPISKIKSGLVKVNITMEDSRLRTIIKRIAQDGLGRKLVLIASSKGYFLTSDTYEINKYKKSLQGRIESQMERYEAVEREQAKIENRKQLSLVEVFYPKSKVS